jgi:O-antigen ligase
VNQAIWLGVAGLGLIAVRANVTRLYALLFATWPLLAVFGFCLMSASWSDQPIISLRRSAGLIVPAFCVLTALASMERPERAARVIYFSFWLALLINSASLPLPGAFDGFGFFKGLTSNKNTLGALAALAILTGLGLSPLFIGLGRRVLLLVYVAGWAELLLLSVSKTSIALAVGIPFVFMFLAIISLSLQCSVRLVLLLLASASILIVTAVSLWLQLSIDELFGVFWHDTTFSGRTPIWAFMWNNIQLNWMGGIGFGSFWEAGNTSPNLYASLDYIRLLNQAHNGYIDLAATIGTIGLILVAFLLAHMMQRADSVRRSNPAAFRFAWLIFLFAVIHNMMESSLLLPFHMVWHVLLLTYIIDARMSLDAVVTTEQT